MLSDGTRPPARLPETGPVSPTSALFPADRSAPRSGGSSRRPAAGLWPAGRNSGVTVMALLAVFGLVIALHCPSLHAQLFEDPPAVISATETLNEEQNDHVEAVTLFAHGRVLLQRGLVLEDAARRAEFAEALRRFQRAWRFDPELVSILEDIAPLTFELERQFEATRYLILAAEQQEVPTDLLERVAAELADLEQFDEAQVERALALYRKLERLQGDAVSVLTQFQIGRLALTLERFDESAAALTAVQRALEDEQSDVPRRVRAQLSSRPEATYALFGESYLRAGKLDEAEAAFRRADQAKPQPELLAFRLALIEQRRGNRERAIELVLQYCEGKSRAAGVAPYALLAELMDPPEAEEDPADEQAAADSPSQVEDRKPSDALLQKLQQLAEADANNPLLGYFLADALRRAERWDQAEAIYRRLINLEPAADGYQGLVAIYRHQRRVAPLLEQLGAVVVRTGSLDPLGELTDAIAGDAPLLDQLQRQLQSASSDDTIPVPEGAPFAVALLCAQAGRHATAMQLFDAGIETAIPTSGQAAVNLAFVMFQANEPEHAAAIFRRILDEKLIADRAAEIYYYLAGALTLSQQYEPALQAAHEAARREPNSARMLAREAWVLFQSGRREKARDKYIELLDKFDADHSSLANREAMRDIRLALSAVEVELDNMEAAQEWLLQTLDEFPEDIGAYNDLGYLWSDQGKHLNRSLRMIRKAVEAEPDNIAYLDSLGWVYYRLGRFEEAIPALEKAAAAKDVDGVILDHLGDAYHQVDQTAKAVETWRKALEALTDGDDRQRREALETKIKQHAGG